MLKALDLKAISSNVQFLWRKKGELSDYLFVEKKGESQVYFVKSSKSETQHDFQEILYTHY